MFWNGCQLESTQLSRDKLNCEIVSTFKEESKCNTHIYTSVLQIPMCAAVRLTGLIGKSGQFNKSDIKGSNVIVNVVYTEKMIAKNLAKILR